MSNLGSPTSSSKTQTAPPAELLQNLDLLQDLPALVLEKDWSLLQEKTENQEWEMSLGHGGEKKPSTGDLPNE